MALKASLVATTATTVTTDVKLQPKTRVMLMERIQEHERISAQVRSLKGTKKKPGRLYRIADEVTELFRKEKQGKALLDGTTLNGHGLKMVIGKTKKFDQMGFMKKHGVSVADFEEFTTYSDNEPYVKFTHPGEDGDD